MDTHDLRKGLHSKSESATLPAFTRTISAEGCTSKSENATLMPAFRALDTHDPRKGFIFRNHASEVLRLPRNQEPRSYEMLHWPRKIILKLKFQKCKPSQELSPSTSKHRIHGANSLRLPWFRNVSDPLQLPRKLTFRTSKCDDILALAMQNALHIRKRAWTLGKTMPSKCPRRKLCASLRSRNQHRISKRHSFADETRGSERAPQWAPGLYSYRENPSVRNTVREFFKNPSEMKNRSNFEPASLCFPIMVIYFFVGKCSFKTYLSCPYYFVFQSTNKKQIKTEHYYSIS